MTMNSRLSDEDTQDALLRLAQQGSDLSRPMLIDFFVVVPSYAAGQRFADEIRAQDFATSLERDDEDQTWTCYCSTTLVPEYSAITDVEKKLGEIAKKHGGHLDGFGSFGNADGG